jgi:hypothetical protein
VKEIKQVDQISPLSRDALVVILKELKWIGLKKNRERELESSLEV